jgi:hypothetical protein
MENLDIDGRFVVANVWSDADQRVEIGGTVVSKDGERQENLDMKTPEDKTIIRRDLLIRKKMTPNS